MTYKYIIIDGDSQSSMIMQNQIAALGDFLFSGYVNNTEEGLNLILEENPDLIFLGTHLTDSTSENNFSLVNELYKYMVILPKIVIISNTKDVAYEAIKYDVYDFLLKPFQKIDIIKALLKFKKEKGFASILNNNSNLQLQNNQVASANTAMQPFLTSVSESKESNEIPVVEDRIVQQEVVQVDYKIDTESIKNELIQIVKQSLSPSVVTGSLEHAVEQVVEQKNNILCIKSYGDYRFIEFGEIVYLKADNNSTDIMLSSGDSITAFKTLKYFEGSLPNDFVRIHNSHIINIKFVSRIHLGNSDCYLNKGKIKLPFSKSYKDNITAIIELYASNDSKED